MFKKISLRWFSRIAIALWAVSLTYVLSTLMIGHWVSMPRPVAGATARFTDVSFVRDARVKESDQVFAFHFLYGDCPCSRRVLKHLVSRDAIRGVSEHIVLIGEDAAHSARAKSRGFQVDCITPGELKSKYGVEAAPLLVIVDQKSLILYSGGYTSRKQGLDIKDQQIISDILAGKQVSDLPAYGCAVSAELKRILDPLNAKSIMATQSSKRS